MIRPAGLLEQYHISRYYLGFDSCVVNAARYIPRNGQDLDQKTLFRGLRRVIESHPALGVRLVAKSPNKASFERLQKIHLLEVVEYSDCHDLQAVIEDQLLQPLPITSSTSPLWRLVVMKNNTICFIWHHCIGDGISGLAFHRALLSALEEGINDKTTANDNVATPSIDIMAPVSLTRGASAWTGNPVSNGCFQTRVRLVGITPSDATALSTLCRSHNATITSALHALAIAILSSLVSTKEYTTISSYVPVSLRSLAGVTNDLICDYASTMHTYPRIIPAFSWREAARYASYFKSKRAKARQEIGMLKFLSGDYASFCRHMLGRKRKGGFEISNVGRFDDPGIERNYSEWNIGHMVFAQSDPIAGSALKMNVVGDPLGGINLSLTWEAGVISDLFGDEFVSRFRTGIQKLLSTDGDTVSFTSCGLVEEQ